MIMPGKLFLRAASIIYGMAVAVRNWLYDLGILRSHSFRLPVICLGNITAGGTGKTPHVIYLAEKLSSIEIVLKCSLSFPILIPSFFSAELGKYL